MHAHDQAGPGAAFRRAQDPEPVERHVALPVEVEEVDRRAVLVHLGRLLPGPPALVVPGRGLDQRRVRAGPGEIVVAPALGHLPALLLMVDLPDDHEPLGPPAYDHPAEPTNGRGFADRPRLAPYPAARSGISSPTRPTCSRSGSPYTTPACAAGSTSRTASGRPRSAASTCAPSRRRSSGCCRTPPTSRASCAPTATSWTWTRSCCWTSTPRASSRAGQPPRCTLPPRGAVLPLRLAERPAAARPPAPRAPRRVRRRGGLPLLALAIGAAVAVGVIVWLGSGGSGSSAGEQSLSVAGARSPRGAPGR